MESRRFGFFDMEPGFDSKGFLNYQKGFNSAAFDLLIDKIKELNGDILKAPSLEKDFCIGHSYFCNLEECTDDVLKDIVDFDIVPMLSEYWFDDNTKLQKWEIFFKEYFNDKRQKDTDPYLMILDLRRSLLRRDMLD